MVISKFCSPAQFSIEESSSSLIPFNATVFSLIFNPAFFAASNPFKTTSSFPHLVIRSNFSGSNVSIDTLIRLTPASNNRSENLCNWLPFVVMVISSSFPFFTCVPRCFIKCIIFLLTSGSPPVRRIFFVPSSIKLSQTIAISSNVKRSFFGKKVICSDMQ